MSLPKVYQYPTESAFACSIDVPNGAKVDFMKDGVVNAWMLCESEENFAQHPGYVGYIFESVEFYNNFTRNPQEKCWIYRGGLQCCTHFKTGPGLMKWSNGDVYRGRFDVNSMDGQGAYTFADGREYIGEFESDEPTGQGKMTWSNGTSFTGFFSEGTFDVTKPCEITFSNGEMCRGRLDGIMKYLWDSTRDYCIWDMHSADPVIEGKETSGGYWREGQIKKIKFEKKNEPASDSDSDSDEDADEKEEPLHPNVTVREKQPRTFTRAEDNGSENIQSLPICGGCNKLLIEDEQNICSGCNAQHYCSSECQKTHWKTHKKMCKELGVKK
jgi:hypothetical protein